MGIIKVITQAEAGHNYLVNCYNYVTDGHTKYCGAINVCKNDTASCTNESELGLPQLQVLRSKRYAEACRVYKRHLEIGQEDIDASQRYRQGQKFQPAS